jgi:hypothetical protein
MTLEKTGYLLTPPGAYDSTASCWFSSVYALSGW